MTLDEVKTDKPKTLTIQQASDIMGVSKRFLQVALSEGKFPFGVGIRMKQNEFYINTDRFIQYMEGVI